MELSPMSSTKVKKIGASVLYLSGSKKDSYLPKLLSGLFEDCDIENALQNRIEDKDIKRFSNYPLIVCDIGSDEKDAKNCSELLDSMATRDYDSKFLIIYDEGAMEKTILSILKSSAAICYTLSRPYNKKSLSLLLKRLYRDFNKSSIDNTPEQKSDSEEMALLIDFYKNRALNIKADLDNLNKILKLLKELYSDKKISLFLNEMKKYLSNIDDTVAILMDFSDELGERDGCTKKIFDINIMLKSIHNTMQNISSSENREFDIIFAVEKSVPAKMLGHPLSIENRLLKILKSIFEMKSLANKTTINIYTVTNRNDFLTLHFKITTKIEGECSDEEKELISRNFDNLTEEFHIDTENERCTIELTFPISTVERRSYRLPSKDMMRKRVLSYIAMEDLRISLEKMLGYFHFATDHAHNDKEFEKLFNSDSYDIVILENGSLQKWMRACKYKTPWIKLVALQKSSERESESEENSFIDAILYSPFTQKDIMDMIVSLYSSKKKNYLNETLILKDFAKDSSIGKSLLFIGREDSDKTATELLVAKVNISFKYLPDIDDAMRDIYFYDMIIIELEPFIADLYNGNSSENLKRLVTFLRHRGKFSTIIGLVDSERFPDMRKISEYTGIEIFLTSPIDPEEFYKTLVDIITTDPKKGFEFA